MTGSLKTLPLILTVAGVLPFLAGGIGMAVFVNSDPAPYAWSAFGLVFYAGTILSFLGGIRWGAAITREPVDGGAVAMSVVPSLLAVAVMAYAFFRAVSGLVFGVFAALFVLQWLWDFVAIRRGSLPKWFALQRHIATAGAVTGLLIAAFSAR